MQTSPRPPEAAPTARGTDGEPADAPAARVILLVEDDEALRRALARRMRQAVYQVDDTASSIDTVGLIDGGEAVDLLVTDVIVPGRPHGFALARMARPRRRDLKIIDPTGPSSIPEAGLATIDGMVLQKPIEPDHRIQEIGRVLAEAPPAR